MKYFVTVKLKTTAINELVFAAGSMDADVIAKANVGILVEDWNEQIQSCDLLSFYELGILACNCDPRITYAQGDYYYKGRRINDDIEFFNGFAETFSHNNDRWNS